MKFQSRWATEETWGLDSGKKSDGGQPDGEARRGTKRALFGPAALRPSQGRPEEPSDTKGAIPRRGRSADYADSGGEAVNRWILGW